MKRLILFDLDGTLIDPYDAITKGAQYALKHAGFEINDRSVFIPFIGPPLRWSLKEFTKITDKEKIEEIVKKYREYFGKHGIYENTLYPGISEMLERLKNTGHHLAIATSKLQSNAVEIAEYLGIDRYFDLITGCEPDGARSEKNEVIEHVLALFGEKAKSPVIVGDRKFDVVGAKLTGIESIGVTWGYGPREELEEAGADYIAESVDELLQIIGV